MTVRCVQENLWRWMQWYFLQIRRPSWRPTSRVRPTKTAFKKAELDKYSLRKRQKNWIGHVLRHDSLLQKVIEGRFQGKKTPGRPRTMLLDALMQEDEESVIDYAKLKEKAHDRETRRRWERTCLWAENTNNNNNNSLILTSQTINEQAR